MSKAALGAALAALALSAYAIIAGVGQHNTITQMRAQLAQAQAVQARAVRLIDAQQAKLAGGHRDLVTCADLSALINAGGLASYWVDANSSLQSTPDSLPSHCING